MHLKRKRVETQLPEEYTRVTNPERMRPIQDYALQFFARLANEYEVAESEGFEAPFEVIPDFMRRVIQTRPPIALTPKSSVEAPIAIAFTSFPGLALRCGRFFNTPFPICGCDHCAETANGEIERLQGFLHNVIGGHFLEEVRLPIVGVAQVRWELGSMDGPYGLSGGGLTLSRERARKLRRSKLKRVEWQAWSKRQ